MPDAIAIQGQWVPLKAELAGESAPAEMLQRMEVEFRAGRYVVRFGGEIADAGDYILTSHEEPKSLRLSATAGPNSGRIIPCIYQLTGDRLRICHGLAGALPPAFVAAAGTEHYLVTYRRKIS